MDNIELLLKRFLNKCREIVKSYPTNIHALDSFKVVSGNNSHFQKFLKEIESTLEFESFVSKINNVVLDRDLERLAQREEKIIKKQKTTNIKNKIFDKSAWRYTIAKHATHCFFINTGTYYNVWNSIEIDETFLLNHLLNYDEKISEYVRLFVFDGFVLYDEKTKISNINLPVGILKIYEKDEAENLFKVLQLVFHGLLKKDIQKHLSDWHVLTLKTNENYRGQVGFWIGDNFYPPLNLHEIDEPEWENDLDIIAPIFLCLGSDINLAEIINLRTNIFDSYPISRKEINGYLPHDNIDEDGNFYPRKTVIKVGENGFILEKLYELWNEIKELTKTNILLYPTQSYIRAILNRHKSNINYDSNLMNTFVSIISSIESLLTPESNEGLLYKASIRAASLISDNPTERLKHFENLSECYKIRSKIVHEGHTNGKRLDNVIDIYLLPLSQHLLIRYMTLIHLLLNHNMISNSLLPNLNEIQNKEKKLKAISKIFDIIIIDSSILEDIKTKLGEWGIKDIKLYNHFKFN